MVIGAIESGTAELLGWSQVGWAVVEEAYRRLGIDASLRIMPGAVALNTSNAGQVDAELLRISSLPPEFTNLVRVDVPIWYIQGVVVTRDAPISNPDWVSLRDVSLGIVERILFIEESVLNEDVVIAPTLEELFDLLDEGRVDAIAVPRTNALPVMVQRDGDYQMSEAIQTSLLFHYVHERHIDLVPRLETVLKEMLLSGEVHRITAAELEAFNRSLGS